MKGELFKGLPLENVCGRREVYRPEQEIGKGKLWPAKSNGPRLAIILRRPLVPPNASKP